VGAKGGSREGEAEPAPQRADQGRRMSPSANHLPRLGLFSWLVVLTVFAVIASFVGEAHGANHYATGGQKQLQPASDLTLWISTSSPPPNGEVGLARWTGDIEWAGDQYNSHPDGTSGIDVDIVGTDSASNLDVVWRGLGSTGPLMSLLSVWTGDAYQCGLSTSDCRLSVNTSHSWHTGSGSPPSNRYDARSVLLHEIGHAYGLGHSDASNIGDTPVMNGGFGTGATRRILTKDDCASLNFQTSRIATCNWRMDRKGAGPGTGASDPQHFEGYNLNNAWHYQSCSSAGGLSVSTWGCHWRVRAKPGNQAAVIYDLEGSHPLYGNQVAGSNTVKEHYDNNGTPTDVRFRVRAVVGAPNYNPTQTNSFSICLYLRIGNDATQPHKAGQSCATRSWSGFHNWETIFTPWYTMPADAETNEYLRTFLWFGDVGSLYIADWQVERSPNEG